MPQEITASSDSAEGVLLKLDRWSIGCLELCRVMWFRMRLRGDWLVVPMQVAAVDSQAGLQFGLQFTAVQHRPGRTGR